MNFLSIFGSSNSPSQKSDGLLSNPGDTLFARITDTGRKVLKLYKDHGDFKHSAVQYPNGTIVETIVKKKK